MQDEIHNAILERLNQLIDEGAMKDQLLQNMKQVWSTRCTLLDLIKSKPDTYNSPQSLLTAPELNSLRIEYPALDDLDGELFEHLINLAIEQDKMIETIDFELSEPSVGGKRSKRSTPRRKRAHRTKKSKRRL